MAHSADTRKSAAEQPRFAPVMRGPRLSDVVAADLLAMIRSKELSPGDRLPSERELGDQFGVSRTVIREAVRSLAAKGTVDVSPGRGVTIATIDAGSVSSSMDLYLRTRESIDYEAIHEVRSMIEIKCARLAALNCEDADVVAMQSTIAEMLSGVEDLHRVAVADVAFHRAVAEAGKNELLVVMLDSIGDIMLEVRLKSNSVKGRARDAAASHQAISERIAAGDPDGAVAAMEAHLGEAHEIWRKIDKPVVSRRASGSAA